ncbi:unnamed protein product, partial [Urochloa humidicola]
TKIEFYHKLKEMNRDVQVDVFYVMHEKS